jgi:hypothetical protein
MFKAHELGGWNTSRSRWGLPRLQRPAKAMAAAARRVQEAGAAVPLENINLTRAAWVWQVLRRTKMADARIAAFIIAEMTNTRSGFAFMSYETLSEWTGWRPLGGNSEGEHKRSAKACAALDRLGLIVRSPGNQRGAHGRIGPSYAMTPPPGMTWDEVLSAHKATFMTKRDEQKVATTDHVEGRSMPHEVVTADHAEGRSASHVNGSSRPSTGSDQTIELTPRPPTGSDQLSADSSYEGERWEKGAPSFEAPQTAHQETTQPGQSDAAPHSDSDLDPIRHWLQPNVLPNEAKRLVEALSGAVTPHVGKHWDALRANAKEVAALLHELRRFGVTGSRLARELTNHDNQLDSGLRDKFRPKKPQFVKWSKAAGRKVEEHVVGMIHYLASIADRLKARADSLERLAKAASRPS